MNVILSSFKFIVIDILGDFVYWPVWWYTIGLKERLDFSAEQIKKTWIALGLGIWLKNTFVPMYGDRSFIGRLISFFMRIVILIWRLVWFLLWSLIVLVVFLAWVLGPIFVVIMVLRHLKI